MDVRQEQVVPWLALAALQAHSGPIDSSWKYLQQSLPHGLAVSLPGNEPRANPELLQYVYQWCTRFHHDGSMRALLLMLGRFLKQNRFRNLRNRRGN